MHGRLIMMLMLLWIVLNGCNDTRCNPDIFSGISATDANGQALSGPDPDDWRFDDDWGNGIKNYFTSDHQKDCNQPTGYRVIAYPNPTIGDALALHFDKDSFTTIDLRLLNALCGIVVSADQVTSNEIYLQIPNNNSENVLRLYYKFIKDGCEYQGHGDIYTQ